MSAFDQPWSWALPKQQQAALIQGAGAVAPGIIQKPKDDTLQQLGMMAAKPAIDQGMQAGLEGFKNLLNQPSAADMANAELADQAGGLIPGLAPIVPDMMPAMGAAIPDAAGLAALDSAAAGADAASMIPDVAGLAALDSAAAGADAAAGAAVPGIGTFLSAGSDIAQGDYLKGGLKIGGTMALGSLGVPPTIAGPMVSTGLSLFGFEEGTTGVPMNQTGIPQQFEEGTMGASPKAITLDYGDKVINIKNKTAPESLQNSLSKESVAAALAARAPGPLNAGRPQPPASVLEKFGRMATGNDGMLGQAKQALHQGSQRAMQYADGTTGAQGGKSPQGGQGLVSQPATPAPATPAGSPSGGKSPQGGQGLVSQPGTSSPITGQPRAYAGGTPSVSGGKGQAQGGGSGGAFSSIPMPAQQAQPAITGIKPTSYYGELGGGAPTPQAPQQGGGKGAPGGAAPGGGVVPIPKPPGAGQGSATQGGAIDPRKIGPTGPGMTREAAEIAKITPGIVGYQGNNEVWGDPNTGLPFVSKKVIGYQGNNEIWGDPHTGEAYPNKVVVGYQGNNEIWGYPENPTPPKQAPSAGSSSKRATPAPVSSGGRKTLPIKHAAR